MGHDPHGLYDRETLQRQQRTIAFGFDAGGGGGAIAIMGFIVFDKIAEFTAQTTTAVLENIRDDFNRLRRTIEDEITRSAQEAVNYQYWEAYRVKGAVIIGRGLTLTEASFRVSCGLDIMCANEAAARWILIVNGYRNHTSPEIHGDEGYYWHYHPHRNTHTHIWYFQ